MAFLFESSRFFFPKSFFPGLCFMFFDQNQLLIVSILALESGTSQPSPVLDRRCAFQEVPDLFIFQSVDLPFQHIPQLLQKFIHATERHNFVLYGIIGGLDVAILLVERIEQVLVNQFGEDLEPCTKGLRRRVLLHSIQNGINEIFVALHEIQIMLSSKAENLYSDHPINQSRIRTTWRREQIIKLLILLQWINQILQFNGMSFHRIKTEDVLKASHQINKTPPSSSYFKNFKKNNQTHSNCNEAKENGKGKADMGRKSIDNSLQVSSQKQQQQRNHQVKKSESRSHQQFQNLMQETDNSMEELLNSSINQFEKLIFREDYNSESLEDQNYRLKSALGKMKNILKDKLQTALQRQKEELSKMLEDYISLITKLLQDKEELTITIQDISDSQKKQIKEREQLWSRKFEQLKDQRDEQVTSTKNQIDEFLQVIEQYEEEAKADQGKFDELQARIEELEEEKQFYMSKLKEENHGDASENMEMRIEAQSTKIQTLLELLQKTEEENNHLKEEISELRMKKQHGESTFQETSHNAKEIEEYYEIRFRELEEEHEEEFLEYERAIKDTLSKKDECIERLNKIIEGLRERKSTA